MKFIPTKKTQYALVILAIVTVVSTPCSSSLLAARSGARTNLSTLTATYHFDAPHLQEQYLGNTRYDTIHIENTELSGHPGEPMLPVRGTSLLLPQGTCVQSITATSSTTIRLGAGFRIQPAGEPLRFSDPNPQPALMPNTEIYSSSTLYPDAVVTQVGTYEFRGYHLLVLTLYPVQYLPSSGEVFYSPDITVTVHLTEASSDTLLFRATQTDHDAVRTMVDNPEVLSTYTKKPTTPLFTEDEYDLLIITTDDLVSSFEPLKEAHDAQGTETIIMTIDDIYNTYAGVDKPEQLRHCIQDMYETSGIEYVLLGGDNDTIPARMLWVESWAGPGSYETTMPSDLYYACLDGSYNKDEDDKWGEPTDGDDGGDVDLLAEVSVGRATVDDTKEVEFFVEKTLSYMNEGSSSEPTYLRRMLQVGEYLGFGQVADYASGAMNELIEGSNNHGFTTFGIPSSRYTIDTLYDSQQGLTYYAWEKQDLMSKINNGVHLINHLGHANYHINMRLDEENITNLTNEDFCFIYSEGCNAGGFDNPEGYDCIAEYFTAKTSHGAFGGIWNARYGWGMAFTTDGPSQRYHRQFLDAIFKENIREFGRANQDSKHDLISRINEECMRWCYYELNLFGDPAVMYNDPCPQPNTILLTRYSGQYPMFYKQAWDMGYVQVGQSKLAIFRIENHGAEPLHLTGTPMVQITGANAAEFQVTQYPYLSTVQPGAYVFFIITFSPAGSGRRSIDIIIPNDDMYSNPYVVTLMGQRYEAYNANTNVWSKTIQQGIDAANDGDVVLLEDGHYYVNYAIIIEKPITLQSVNGASSTIIDGSDIHRCFVLGNTSATVRGFTITQGYCTAPGMFPPYNLTSGGGVFLTAGVVEQCVIRENYAKNGGGVAAFGAACHVNNCTIVNNAAYLGGGVYVMDGVIDHCTIEGNHGNLRGGGVYSAHAMIRDCVIRENTVIFFGGGIGGSTTTVQRCDIEDNEAKVGGGIHSSSGLFVENCLIRQNRASRGGGIYMYNDESSVSFSTITENQVVDKIALGGGVYGLGDVLKNIYNCIIVSNVNEYCGIEDNCYGSLKITYSCTTPLSPGAGNIAADPLFTFNDPFPYSLQETSPCIDAGDPIGTSMPLFDLAGHPRLIGPFVDMGAFEFQLKGKVS